MSEESDVKEALDTLESPVVGDDIEEGELPEDGEIQDDEEASMIDSPASPPKAIQIANIQQNTILNEKQESQIQDHARQAPFSPDQRHHRRSRSPVRYGPPIVLPPRRRAPWTENVMCKFFREGYCRDDMDCSYSHNATLSNRKPELCKFYSQGFCKKGLACTLLHGEYPCKDFHQGNCNRKPCKYSHVPLNDYTQTIFNQIVQDESIAAQIKIPHQPTRRRTLLSRPPPTSGTNVSSPQGPQVSPTGKRPHPSDNIESSSFDAHSLPPPAKISDNFSAATAAEDPDELLVSSEDFRHQSDDAYRFQIEENRSSLPTPIQNNVAPATLGGLSINDMLNQLTKAPMVTVESSDVNNVDNYELSTDITDTPASPENFYEPIYKLIPLDNTPFNYDTRILKKLTSDKFKDDPRAHVIIQKQFDHDSSMIGQALPTVTTTAPKVEGIPPVAPPRPTDPRLRGIPSDPRPQRVTLRPSGGLLPTPTAPVNPPSTAPIIPSSIPGNDFLTHEHFQSLVEKQLQMVNQAQSNAEPEAPSASQYDSSSRGRHYDDEPHQRGYNDRGGYAGNRRGDFDGYNPRPRYHDEGHNNANYRGRPPRFNGPSRGGSYRGSYHDDGDRFRGPPRSSYASDRHDYHHPPSNGFRREYRDRRDAYPPRYRDSRYNQRSRSRSPLRQTRNHKDYDGYQSPETRA